MGFRNIYIENPARLSIKNRQLIISQDQEPQDMQLLNSL